MNNQYRELLKFLEKFNSPPEEIGKLIYDNKRLLSLKGYGTPELEMKFLHKLFLHIQQSYPEFETFSWMQTNDYNDEYYYFQLLSFRVNERHDIESDIAFFFENYETDNYSPNIFLSPAFYPDPDEFDYARENNLETDEEGLKEPVDWDDFYVYRKKKYKHLHSPCLQFLVILFLLDINYSKYYFLYTFGNSVEIKFSKEGVKVTRLNEGEIRESPLGKGMNLDEL